MIDQTRRHDVNAGVKKRYDNLVFPISIARGTAVVSSFVRTSEFMALDRLQISDATRSGRISLALLVYQMFSGL